LKMRATSVLPDELRRGLVRHARPEGFEGQCAYSMDMQGAGRLVLWGFGVLCECGAVVFVAGDGFSPCLLEATPPKSVFRARASGPWREPATAEQNRDARVVLASLAAALMRLGSRICALDSGLNACLAPVSGA
jgi:hypothetical protein